MPIIETLLHSCSTKGYTDAMPAPECVSGGQTHSTHCGHLLSKATEKDVLGKMCRQQVTSGNVGGMTFLAQDHI